jgi:hypothetical protein
MPRAYQDMLSAEAGANGGPLLRSGNQPLTGEFAMV